MQQISDYNHRYQNDNWNIDENFKKLDTQYDNMHCNQTADRFYQMKQEKQKKAGKSPNKKILERD